MIGTCTSCGKLVDFGSEEEACRPDRLCSDCWWAGHPGTDPPDKKTAATGTLAGDGQVGDGSTSEARGSSATTVAPESPAQGETDTSARPENRGEPVHLLTGSGPPRTACGEASDGTAVTTVPEQVTCSGCLPTARAGIPDGCTCDWMNTGYPSGAPDCPHHGGRP